MWKAVIWCLAIIFLMQFCVAKNISLEYPREVFVDEDFTLKISLIDFPSGDYDIKIDFSDRNFAHIFDNSWKSAYYYSQKAVKLGEEKADIKIKVIADFEGEKYFSVRVRKNGQSTYTEFSDYNLNIKKKVVEEGKIEKTSVVEDNKTIQIKNSDEIKTETKIIENENKEEVIYLTPQNIKKDENKILYTSRSERIKSYAIYAFAVFCIGVIVLLVIDKNGR